MFYCATKYINKHKRSENVMFVYNIFSMEYYTSEYSLV